jgi:hypothetical protein
VNGVADKFSFRRIPDQDTTRRGLGSREILRRLEIPFWKLPGIARHMRRPKAEHLADIELFPEVDTMMRELADARLRLTLVSSDHEYQKPLSGFKPCTVHHPSRYTGVAVLPQFCSKRYSTVAKGLSSRPQDVFSGSSTSGDK